MDLNFFKMEGLGNDFILVDDRNYQIKNYILYRELSIKICDRNFGVGGDGLIVILNSEICDLKCRIFNSDGSETEMCGNGIRCFAKLVYENKIINKKSFKVDTLAGSIIPELNIDSNGNIESIKVDMGIPVLETVNIPFLCDNKIAISEKITIDGLNIEVTAVSMGNPHAIMFVDDVKKAPVTTLGPKVEIFEKFPEKTNVEFIKVISTKEIDMRVWERGVGETLACGTGACAALVAASLNEKTEDSVIIHLSGGDLFIEWNRDNNHIYKTGPANLVFNGRIHI